MISYENNDRTLTIKLPSKIDYDNSEAYGKEIFAVITNEDFDKLVMDADEMEYLSSSGIRVLTKALQMCPHMAIINISNDVYEILDMVGLSELADLSRKLKEISIEGCKIIGQGRNGAVYRLNKDTIVKVYEAKNSYEDIKRERTLARKAFILGVPTALSLNPVMVDGKYGNQYELLDAQSVADKLRNNPDDIEAIVGKFTELFKTLHAIDSGKDVLLADKKLEYKKWMNDLENVIDKAYYDKLSALLESIPDRNCLLHGDYHMGNVMDVNGELLIIDMDTLGFGDPIFDLSNTYFSLNGFRVAKPNDNLNNLPIDMYEKIWNLLLNNYYEGESAESIENGLHKITALAMGRLVRYGHRHNFDQETLNRVMQKLYEELDRL